MTTCYDLRAALPSLHDDEGAPSPLLQLPAALWQQALGALDEPRHDRALAGLARSGRGGRDMVRQTTQLGYHGRSLVAALRRQSTADAALQRAGHHGLGSHVEALDLRYHGAGHGALAALTPLAFPRLRRLRLDVSRTPPAALAWLRGLTQLDSLVLQRPDGAALAPVRHLGGLRRLRLVGLRRGPAAPPADLGGLTQLTSLELDRCAGDAVRGVGLLAPRGLPRLRLRQCVGLRAADMERLDRDTHVGGLQLEVDVDSLDLQYVLPLRPRLVGLCLRRGAFRGDGLPPLAWPYLRHLQRLDCQGLRLEPVALRAIGGLAGLTSLHLGGSLWPQTDLEGLAPLTAMRWLELPDNAPLVTLDFLRPWQQLRRLGLARCGLRVPQLVPLTALGGLERLEIDGNTELDDRLGALLAKLQPLRALSLAHVPVSCGAVRQLADLPALEELCLEGFHFNRFPRPGEGLGCLTALGSLRALSLRGATFSLGDAAVLLQLKQLEVLNVSHTVYVPDDSGLLRGAALWPTLRREVRTLAWVASGVAVGGCGRRSPSPVPVPRPWGQV